jgi:hypothetical protein
MKMIERIMSLFRRQPPTAEELAARAESESMREQIDQDKAVLKLQVDERIGGGYPTPPY